MSEKTHRKLIGDILFRAETIERRVFFHRRRTNQAVVPHHPLGTNGESRRITELIEGAPETEKETNSSAGEIQTNTE